MARPWLVPVGVGLSAFASAEAVLGAILYIFSAFGGGWAWIGLFLGFGASVGLIAAIATRTQRARIRPIAGEVPVINGPCEIAVGSPSLRIQRRLGRGDVVRGTLAELGKRPFALKITPEGAPRGITVESGVLLGDFQGAATSSFQTQTPAPASGMYNFDFFPLGDTNGREIQVDLRRRPKNG